MLGDVSAPAGVLWASVVEPSFEQVEEFRPQGQLPGLPRLGNRALAARKTLASKLGFFFAKSLKRYDKGELASIGTIVYGDGDHMTLPEGQEAADVGLPPGFNYPVSMWDSPPGYFLPPFMGALMSDCVLAINAVLYGVADPEETPNRKASIIHVALKSTLDRQCE